MAILDWMLYVGYALGAFCVLLGVAFLVAGLGLHGQKYLLKQKLGAAPEGEHRSHYPQ